MGVESTSNRHRRPSNRPNGLSSLRRFGRFIGLVGGGAVVCALLAVAVFPTGTFLDQRADRAEAERRLEVLRDQNAAYEDQIERLQTPEEIERIGREEYNLVFPGEEAYAILPAPLPELDLPTVFPFGDMLEPDHHRVTHRAPIGCAAMSVFGDRVVRVEDPKLLTDGGVYVADLRIPELDGALHVTYVRSTIAHARLLSVEVDDARTRPRRGRRLHRRRRRPGGPTARLPDVQRGDDPAVPGPGQGPLRRRALRRDPQRATRAGRGRRRDGVGRLRAAAGRRRARRGVEGRGRAARGRPARTSSSTSPSGAPTTSSTAARWWSSRTC